jgi:hypothetical protein
MFSLVDQCFHKVFVIAVYIFGLQLYDMLYRIWTGNAGCVMRRDTSPLPFIDLVVMSFLT